MNLLTLRQIQYFITLADEGSFSRAAELCHVTQSTLSAGIKEAEALLGRPLFDRRSRKPALSPFGADILDDARQLLEKATHISLRAQQYDQPMSAPIRLGIIPTIAPYLLPTLLPRLQERYPQLHVQIFEDLSERLHESLLRGALDLLIMAFPYATEGAEQSVLFDEDFYLAEPAAASNNSTPARINELNPDDLLLLADGHCLSDHALQACALQRSHQRKTYSTSSLTTLIQMVANGMGKTLLPAMAVEAAQLPATIITRPFVKPAPKRTIGLAWREKSPRRDDYMAIAEVIKGNPY